MQFFSNVPAMSFGADIWEWRETHIKKKEKKKSPANCTNLTLESQALE
jgi:hypothetical protein